MPITTLNNIVYESLVENLLVSSYCIKFRKDPLRWKEEGCYGFPATILLFSIADIIGSYIIGGSTKKHFEIFNNNDYYNLNLSENALEEMYKHYRCLITHNGAMPPGRLLDIGTNDDPVVIKTNSGEMILNLVPFWNKTYFCVEKFLKTVTLENNPQADHILNIPGLFS
jgi:hypothetical protein